MRIFNFENTDSHGADEGEAFFHESAKRNTVLDAHKPEDKRGASSRKSSFAPESPVNDLTPRQLQVYRAMLSFQREHNRAPTQFEISSRLGMKSEQGVKAHLTVLEAKGYVVSRQKGAHRNKFAVEK